MRVRKGASHGACPSVTLPPRTCSGGSVALARAAPEIRGDFEPPFRLKAAAIFDDWATAAHRRRCLMFNPQVEISPWAPTLRFVEPAHQRGRRWPELQGGGVRLGVALDGRASDRTAAQASAGGCAGLDPGGLAGQLVAIRRERETIMAAARARCGAPPPPCRVVLMRLRLLLGEPPALAAEVPTDIALIYTAVHRPQDHGTRAAGGGRLPG